MRHPTDFIFGARPGSIGVLAISLCSAVVVVSLWHYATFSGTAAYVPSAHGVLKEIVQLAQSGSLWGHMLATTQLVAVGVSFGTIVGVTITIACLQFPLARALFLPWILFFVTMSKVGIFYLFSLWLGALGPASKLATLAWITALIQAYVVVRGTEMLYGKEGLESATNPLMSRLALEGASRSRVLGTVVIPRLVPKILTGVLVAYGLGFSFAPLIESAGTERGVGFIVAVGQMNSDANRTFAGMLLLIACAAPVLVLVGWGSAMLTKRFRLE